MTQTTSYARARAERKKALQQRQTVIFGVIVVVLLVFGLLSGLMWANIIPSPISRPITSPTAPVVATKPWPCPPDNTLPVPYTAMTVEVLNGTRQPGLAGRTASDLQGLGVNVVQATDAKDRYTGATELTAGPNGLGVAYTLAALFPDAQITLDEREDAGVSITVGSKFTELRTADQVALDPNAPLPAPTNCKPLTPAGG